MNQQTPQQAFIFFQRATHTVRGDEIPALVAVANWLADQARGEIPQSPAAPAPPATAESAVDISDADAR